mgnify:CR=1 FL=1
MAKITPKLVNLDKFFTGKKYAIGDYVTYIDFEIAEFSHYLERMFPEEYVKYTSFKKIRETFYELPEIKKYYDNPDRIKMPFVEEKEPVPFPAW